MAYRTRDKKLVWISFLFWIGTSLWMGALAQSKQISGAIIVGDSTLSLKDKVVLTGKVTDAAGLPIVGASISVDTYKYFDYSDKDGRFLIELPAGNYRLMIRFVGKQIIFQRIRLFSTGVLNFELTEEAVNLDEIVISSRPIDSNVKSALSGVSIFNIAEVKALPTFLGEVDILKTIQLLPGVTSVGEGSSGFNVRGGRVDQNLILLNGTPIFNASHALGFVPAFNQDVLRNFSLYKGNVPANYGGRASSVLDITTRTGNFEKWEFQGGLGIASSRVTVEGPLIKDKTSILLSGRISNANWLLRQVDDPNVNRSSVFFYDANATISHNFNENSKLQLNYYSSYDYFRFSDQFAYGWQNQTTNLEWRSLANRKISPTLLVAVGRYKNSQVQPTGVGASTLDNQLNYTQVKESIQYIPNDNHEIVVGGELMFYQAKPEKLTPFGDDSKIKPGTVQKNRGLESSVFVSDNWKLNKRISLSAGLRYSGFMHVGEDTVFRYKTGLPKSANSISDTLVFSKNKLIDKFGGLEPRFSGRFSLKENQSIKISFNRMRQYIHLISNTAAPTPVDLWQTATEYLPPQTSDNYSIGYFLNQKDNAWEASIEGFFKEIKNMVEYKDFASFFLNRHIETELISAQGQAYGGEFYIRKLSGIWSGWISYTYSRSFVRTNSLFSSEQINRGEWYAAGFDRPHNANLVVNRKFRNSKNSWSLLMNYTTGRPITAIESSYIFNSVVIPLYSDRNQYRIPNYFRIDFSLNIASIFKKLDDSLTLSVYNLLGRDNAYSVFYTRPGSNFVIPKPYKLSVLGATFPSLVYNFKF